MQEAYEERNRPYDDRVSMSPASYWRSGATSMAILQRPGAVALRLKPVARPAQ
jgi:hypothetical protein